MNKKHIVFIFAIMLLVCLTRGISVGGSVDVNGDGVVNTADLEFVGTHLGRLGEHAADVNDDNVVNIADLMLVKNAIDTPVSGVDDMVLIPAGAFQMGSTEGFLGEHPGHTVYVDAFYMDKYEVTNAEYKKFVDANPQWQKVRIERRFHTGNYLHLWNGNNYPEGKGDHPVVHVSWYGAMAYSRWAGKRLPTEAEWEKAARGGLAGKRYPWGNTIDATKANYDGNVADTTPVGSYPVNGYGLYDMSGNVWEWCLDEYDRDFYRNSPGRNPISGANNIAEVLNAFSNNNLTNDRRVLRGGSWAHTAANLRTTGASSPTGTSPDLGFRCARTQ